jgi:flagellar biosynthetic protein FliR
MPTVELVEMIAKAPAYALVMFRVLGLFLFAPLFGSSRIPRRVRFFMALVMSVAMVGDGLPTVVIPDNLLTLTLVIAGEMLFGFALGMTAAMVLIAAQWAGELIGQQMGFNLGSVIDPQFGAAGSVVGDAYFLLTLTIFLLLGGHRELVEGVHLSLTTVPPPLLLPDGETLSNLVDAFGACAALALRIAAPIFVTKMIVDVALGCLTKSMPQFNVMSASLSLKAIVGMLVIALCAGVTTGAFGDGVWQMLEIADRMYAK